MDVRLGDRRSYLFDTLYILTPQQEFPKAFSPLPEKRELSEKKSKYQKIDLVGREDHGEPREEFQDKWRCGVDAQQMKYWFSGIYDGHAGQGEHGHNDAEFEGGSTLYFFFIR